MAEQHPATLTGPETHRETAEVVDSRDGAYVAPPTVDVAGEPPQGVLDAVLAAIGAEPNAGDSPKVYDAESHSRTDPHALAYLTVRLNEIPQTGGSDDRMLGWLPPYRAQERIEAQLREQLPADVKPQAIRDGIIGIYPA